MDLFCFLFTEVHGILINQKHKRLDFSKSLLYKFSNFDLFKTNTLTQSAYKLNVEITFEVAEMTFEVAEMTFEVTEMAFEVAEMAFEVAEMAFEAAETVFEAAEMIKQHCGTISLIDNLNISANLSDN